MLRCHDNTAQINDVFQMYKQKMYHIAFAILHDPYQAEDAVMNAFVRMLERNYKLEDPSSDKTKRLIITVTRTAAIDLYRKNQRERERESLSDEPKEELRDAMLWSACENDGDLQELLDALPVLYREVLIERFIKDRSTQETARALGISEATVRKRQERALRMMREKTGKKGEDNGILYKAN